MCFFVKKFFKTSTKRSNVSFADSVLTAVPLPLGSCFMWSNRPCSMPTKFTHHCYFCTERQIPMCPPTRVSNCSPPCASWDAPFPTFRSRAPTTLWPTMASGSSGNKPLWRGLQSIALYNIISPYTIGYRTINVRTRTHPDYSSKEKSNQESFTYYMLNLAIVHFLLNYINK